MLPWLFTPLLLVCCAYGAWRGGTPERIGAAILMVASVASVIALSLSSHRYMRTEVSTMWVDIAMTGAFMALALRAQRFWPIWVCMVQLDMLATHIVMFARQTPPWSYWAMEAVWSYPAPLLLAAGTWRHRRRLREFQSDPAWS